MLCVVSGEERVARAIFEIEGEGADFGQSACAHFQDLAAEVPPTAEDEHTAVETRRAGVVHIRPSLVTEFGQFSEGTYNHNND